MNGWIGVDLDGTLAEYHGWKGTDHIGEPIPAMVDRVKCWLTEGKDVRIFTARMAVTPWRPDELAMVATRTAIEMWCKQHIGFVLPVTNVKDFGLIELWDDRAVQVIENTGLRADGKSTDLEVFDNETGLRVRGSPGMALETVMVTMEVLKERQRQVIQEGWTPPHDDSHARGQLATAAACYVAPDKVWWEPIRWWHRKGPYLIWPWHLSWWKPSPYRRALIKAAALVIAEIERLDRIEAKS